MTHIYIDQFEPPAIALFLRKHDATVERLLLNRPANPPRPDYGGYTHDGKYVGVSRKQAGEFIGGIDACEAQLLDEMGGCDYMALLIEGRFSSTPSGQCYIWEYGEGAMKARDSMAYGSVQAVRREYRQSYKGVWQKLMRFQDLGIMVIQTAGMEDTALALIALYAELSKPDAALTTFKRLIPEKYRLDEPDAAKKRLALQLMSVAPGVGEEVALAICDGGIRSIADIVMNYSAESEAWGRYEFEKLPLRSGKRTIGPAAVRKLREALGC